MHPSDPSLWWPPGVAVLVVGALTALWVTLPYWMTGLYLLLTWKPKKEWSVVVYDRRRRQPH